MGHPDWWHGTSLLRWLAVGVEDFFVAYGVAVALLERVEDYGRDHGEDAQADEGFVDAVDHFGGGGGSADVAGGDEESGGEAGGGYSEADGHLLHGAGDGTGGAGLLLVGVGVDQGVHAGVLQRGEGSVEEGEKDDRPDVGMESDGSEEEQQDAEDEGIRDEHPAVADGGEQAGHEGFHAHRGKGLGHDEQAGLDRGEA